MTRSFDRVLGLMALLMLAPAAQAAIDAEWICEPTPLGEVCRPKEPWPLQKPQEVTGHVDSPSQFWGFVWHAMNRQTLSFMPTINDVGGPGTEGNNGASIPCDDSAQALDPNAKGNPIIESIGSKIEREIDFATGGEMPLYLTRTWNHFGYGGGLFGSKWSSNFDFRLIIAADQQSITAYRPNGAQLRYVWRSTPAAGWWEDRPEARSYIVAIGGKYVLYARDHTTETYGSRGFIESQKDPRGVGLAFQYITHYPWYPDGSGPPLLERVSHTNGRAINFAWTHTAIGPQMAGHRSSWSRVLLCLRRVQAPDDSDTTRYARYDDPIPLQPARQRPAGQES